MIRVVNASPLIALSKAGLPHLLSSPPDVLLVPEAVASEILAGSERDPARILLAGGFGTRCPPSPAAEAVLEWGLGSGESAVISEAMRRPGTEAVLDDAAARRCARGLGVPVIGTLGLVARAKRTGRVAAAAPLFAALREAGLYFSDELALATLEAIGEAWPTV